MEQEKKCENCKYFVVHYVKTNIGFNAVYGGHCTRGKIYLKKVNLPDDCCEKWESDEVVKKERKERIETVLKSMRTTLSHIEQILKEDTQK